MTRFVKRLIDVVVSLSLLILLLPLLFFLGVAIFVTDFGSPLYVAQRVGLNQTKFRMYKLRSMVVNAEAFGPETTQSTDPRITNIGKFVRKIKADELMQLVNVAIGDMSLVGPRPNTVKEVAKYSLEELKLITVKPGITDISSIIFSDEGEILATSNDPVADYDELIRPWKYKFSIFYIEKQSNMLDLCLCFITFISILNKRLAFRMLFILCKFLNADAECLEYIQLKRNLYT